ncbi:hypothetical protein HMPREF0012_01749 [Acinetobacter calcoaceticus RUH2202]|uniref:hypothetical protein n=1 Tax=Acinetobacter calcoaceticus TaxID=471 RepID=UPI0001BB52CC|nr:hypothetical protein [Acinetobacter calcoaceticus]EEY78880.1 hypothetical protein HMPREF0012_01749 [Acinetobacter calcoaceticus RUH2202]
MKTKDLIGNVVAVSFVSLLFIFALTWIIFDFNGSSSSLKDTWSIVGSVFGGITTLAAAYIAYYLYDDWSKPHNLSIETEHKKDILKIIRKILPLEHKYDGLISKYLLYPDQPDRTIPIEINESELNEFINNINELLGLLNELYFITKDENIKNLTSKYFSYAQLYHFILSKSEFFYKNGSKEDLLKFLRLKLDFDFIDLDGQKWTTHTTYGFAIRGLDQVDLRKYISENLKIKENNISSN